MKTEQGGAMAGRKVKLVEIGERVREGLGLVWFVAVFPFRLIAMIFRFGFMVAANLVRGTIYLGFALLGLVFFGWVTFALVRVIFHPLFV
jgi:hypothetical protein